MSYLLDTNIVSEANKVRPSQAVLDWLDRTPADRVYLSVMTIGEFRQGIEGVRNDANRAAVLEAWLVSVKDEFRDRIIPVDLDIAERWGRLDEIRRVPTGDGLIAATALVRGWAVVTRNVRDFEWTGVPVINPFEGDD